MDRKVFLALVLSAVVVVVFQLLFPPPKPTTRPAVASSATSTATGTATPSAAATATSATPGAVEAGALPRDSATQVAGSPATAAETTVVETAKVRYRVSSLGARPVGAELREYTGIGPDGRRTTRPVELMRQGDALVGYRLVVPGDTIDLSRVPFALVRGQASSGAAPAPLQYRATLPNGIAVAITYTFAPDNDTLSVDGRVENAPKPAFLLAELPRALASSEADTLEDSRHRAVAYKPDN